MSTRSRGARLAALFAAVAGVAYACGGVIDVTRPPPLSPLTPVRAAAAWDDARQVFESRCVVCHGCYDAPCQLKLGTFEGIERGATTARVYDSARLLASDPTRLGVDAHGPAAWRAKGFHPVLAEGKDQDPRASLLLRMLALKHAHPLPAAADLASQFTFELDRKETCTTEDAFEDYATRHPLWGMPYALPGLAPNEEATLVNWVHAGAPHRETSLRAGSPVENAVAGWEALLNEPGMKGALVGRYLYEHLFLASLHFTDAGDPSFFRVVRSRTPPGTAVDEIPTRRPFDDPGTPRFYYRLQRRIEAPLDKTHMPYPLSDARLQHYRALFLSTDYEVSALPGYSPEVAANPFRAFQALPVKARYRFMLDEADFTMMGFIKGPVCRGQVALNVIEDRFWIAFFDPDVPWGDDEASFLTHEKQDLDMPAEAGSTSLLPTRWFGYASSHARYVDKKIAFFEQAAKKGKGLDLTSIWDGDPGAGGKRNPNAALTVFRHFDSATVVRGFLGAPPKTAWVVGYPLLERIHYLLVAGFDVFGNVGHQVTSRLYMDFLRMEGESNFLLFLPEARRRALTERWYRGVSGAAKERVVHELTGFTSEPKARFPGPTPEVPLFEALASRTGAKDAVDHAGPGDFALSGLTDLPLRASLERLARVSGEAAAALPELAFMSVREEDGSRRFFTVARDSGHTNVAHLFNEDARRVPAEDALSVVQGFLGSYPNALFDVPRAQVDAFVEAVAGLDGEPAYKRLRLRFGVLRTSGDFWAYSDALQEAHRRRDPVDGGIFDYNRLEAF